MLVLVTAYLGYYLGLRSQENHMITLDSWLTLLCFLLGTWAASASAAVLNQVIERDQDSKMIRTKNRPLAKGSIQWVSALVFGIILGVFGFIFLYKFVNSITAWISIATILLYVFIYTPSKKISTWNTIIGSIPGALPPVGGWTAATGTLDAPAWILFGILFCWQMPHFLAIAIIYAADYERGGVKTYELCDIIFYSSSSYNEPRIIYIKGSWNILCRFSGHSWYCFFNGCFTSYYEFH